MGTDDIYVFEKAPFVVSMQGTVLSKATTRRLDSAKVVLYSNDENKTAIDSLVTSLTGNFHFNVKAGRAYTIQVTRNGYYEDSMLVANSGSQKILSLQTDTTNTHTCYSARACYRKR